MTNSIPDTLRFGASGFISVLGWILGSRKVFWGLLAANAASSILVFFQASGTAFPDAVSYVSMAEGIAHGKYSAWYFLPFDTPDTLRMWGYPFFLFVCGAIGPMEPLAKGIQLLSHWGSLFLSLGILSHLSTRREPRNIFLFLTSFNVQVPYYSGLIATESLTVFFTTWYVFHLLTRPKSPPNAVLLGLIGGVIFQIRPAFLLFPFLLFSFSIVGRFSWPQMRYSGLQLAAFSLTLLPFSLWNYRHHGVFKPTPLQGGAGAAYQGAWTYKLPAGHDAGTNNGSSSVTNDFFMFALNPISAERRTAYAREFDDERRNMFAYLSQFESTSDAVRSKMMAEAIAKTAAPYPTHSARYTLQLEKEQWRYTLLHAKEDPLLYAWSRLITFCRNWFTGINMTEMANCKSFGQYARTIYPFLVTFLCIFGGLIFVSLALLKYRGDLAPFKEIYLLILYTGASNALFLTQARYTVPVHLLLLCLVASSLVYLAGWHKGNSAQRTRL